MLLHYKCPNCGSDMAFDSETGHLACGSCGREDNIENLPEENIEMRFDENEAREYQCNNCGAEVITDSDTTATSCSFCGAGVVLADRLSGILAPAKVIPFTISKEEATNAFIKWCKKSRLTPREFMSASRIKKITGMYVPFWIYDLNGDIKMRAVGTKVRKYTSGDYDYTETKYYDIERHLDLYYTKVPVDASEKLDDKIMDKLEPYNYNDLVDFRTAYLAGYLAEKYNFDGEQLLPRVKEKIKKYIDSYLSSTTTQYTTVTSKQESRRIEQLQSLYVLLPIWMVYYDFDKQEHTFAMNGQTGKIVGKPPISPKKVATYFSGIALSSFVVVKLIAYIIGGVFW